MNDLPKSFLVVLAFAVLAIGLILFFVFKQFMFQRHKRKGEEALQRRDYNAAVESFGRAIALWDFNTTKQTTPSYLGDLAKLDEVLERLEAAARAAGITLAAGEYRDAVKAVRAYFENKEVGDLTRTGKTYASAFTRLKSAQSALMKQLRVMKGA